MTTQTLIQLQKTAEMPDNAHYIEQPFLEKILKPYRTHAIYLKSASITQFRRGSDATSKDPILTAEGVFSIPASCYIDDTGHFNAVEFNICYNQLAYVMFGKSLSMGMLQQALPFWEEKVKLTFDVFMRQQLSSMLIVRIDGKFLKQLNSDHFYATITLDRVVPAGTSHFAHTSVAFFDDEGVKSKGSVLLAFNPITA